MAYDKVIDSSVLEADLTSVADAIRGKTGTTGELAFPDGYVSAVNDISSVSDLSNAKDIAFGGNESGGKYVIEDETITPLFNQVKRITETEDAMTFEGATESLLNVVPGGGLPNAEESVFGANDADIETGIITLGTIKTEYLSGTYYSCNKYTAKEAISIIGLRMYSALTTTARYLRLWNANGEKVRETDQITPTLNAWTTAYFDEPFNVAVGETFYISGSAANYPTYSDASNTTFNAKVTWDGGSEKGANSGVTSLKFSKYFAWGVFDFIIGKASTELPDEYQVARSTMDDIANEIKRISNTTGKITTSQMLIVLQSIKLQDKSVTPTAEVQTITPDDGYYGLSSVTVGAITE